ncbi:MAG TPA: hypothetical protein VJQ54_18990, partial [Candidatus Sulfotelmatobacter sp.]|nr:hypothetical protein [Candidatus Sulfotelmatobacter sp.]
MFARKPFAGFAIVLFAASCVAQEDQHGTGERLGSVHFVTGCNAGAQKEFDRAVALLHSFQFNHAIEGFNAALKRDPSCAMPYWGIALSEWSNPFGAGLKQTSQLEAGRKSVRLGKAAAAKSERERAYIAAVAKLYNNFEQTPQRTRLLAYRDAMQDLASRYPDDREAQIFYALALAAAEEPTDKSYAARLKAGAILEKLFREEPNHPGLAHYIIHTYDVPPLAGKALVAARRYSEIAPDAPHALHMPSHTFTRVGYWQESIDANLAAAAVSRRQGQTAEELHASDYLMYAYLQTAQDQAARKVLQALPEIASRFDPKMVVSGAAGPDAGYFALAAIPARFSLERHDWQGAAELEPRATPFPYTESMSWFARGIAAARLHDLPKAR